MDRISRWGNSDWKMTFGLLHVGHIDAGEVDDRLMGQPQDAAAVGHLLYGHALAHIAVPLQVVVGYEPHVMNLRSSGHQALLI